MDREPAGVSIAGSGTSGARPGRRLAAAGLAVIVILLVAVAVLATRLVSDRPDGERRGRRSPSPSPSATASLTVPAIYQRIAPSVVGIQAGRGFGTGVIVADDGTIITADHVIANASAIVVTYADGTLTRATVLSADKQLDIALLAPARLPADRRSRDPRRRRRHRGIRRRDRRPARPHGQRDRRRGLRA